MRMPKARVNLTVDADRVAQARAVGTNLSAVLDDALAAEVHRLESLRDLAQELAELDAHRTPAERTRAQIAARRWVSDTFGPAVAELESPVSPGAVSPARREARG